MMQTLRGALTKTAGRCLWLISIAFLATPTAQAIPGTSLGPQGLSAENPQWLALLHYERGVLGARSAIHSPEFFLSERGHQDPKAELTATIAAMSVASPIESDDDARCRFPARRLFLARHIAAIREGLHRWGECMSFSEWSGAREVQSISLIYITGYLGNPASYFGHALIKFNFGDPASRGLLDRTLNYGAILEGWSDPVSYDGGFSEIAFHFHDREYGEIELRDMWEYELKLSAETRQFLVAHAWEILGRRYTYWFIRKNCAFRIAEALETSGEISILPRSRPWLIPQAVVQKAMGQLVGDQPLIASVTYHPSRQSRFHARYAALTPRLRKSFRQLIASGPKFPGTQSQSRDPTERAALLDTILDYERMIADPKATEAGQGSERYNAALSERFDLDAQTDDPTGPLAVGPHSGRPPSWTQLGVTHTSTGAHALLRIRAAYYDALDGAAGHIPNSALTLGDISLQIDAHAVRLRRLILLGVDSANPSVTSAEKDGGTAWRIQTGLEPVRIGCDSCLVARLQGDYGISRQLGGPVLSAYVGGGLQSRRSGNELAFSRVALALTGPMFRSMTARAAVELRVPLNATYGPYWVGQLEARAAIGKRFDLRAAYDYDRGHAALLGVGMYW
jgi:hypothetical protein